MHQSTLIAFCLAWGANYVLQIGPMFEGYFISSSELKCFELPIPNGTCLWLNWLQAATISN